MPEAGAGFKTVQWRRKGRAGAESSVFPSVLIANRGEIACRIIRTARVMGMRTIAVFSDADRHAQHVKLADEAHHIGPSPALQSYLRADVILRVAKASNAACIHPGYGFLSENAEFAEACARDGIVFIGPSPHAIRAMGLKDEAKALMQKAGVPVVRGYHGPDQSEKFLKEKACETGYPVLIKAVAGGGGKGMRRVDGHADFAEALAGARREAQNAFGNPHVLIEKYISRPRHIEMQVLGDACGNAVHLFERDCSLQRRHQKVIEEAPAPGMTPGMRAAMGKAAVEAARAVDYCGAGTVEFIIDSSNGLRPDAFFFMEMNTRLQVEHPVTEMITGLDLVEWQFRVAAGEKLGFAQEDLRISGHAVEARVYAEDPEREFLPSTGKLEILRLPGGEGVRIDSGVAEGDEIASHYDPMIAKVIAHGATRDEALDRLGVALGQTVVMGPDCNLAFLRALCSARSFRGGDFDTGFISANLSLLGACGQSLDAVAVAAGARLAIGEKLRGLETDRLGSRFRDPFDSLSGFQLLASHPISFELVVGERRLLAECEGPMVDICPIDGKSNFNLAIKSLGYFGAGTFIDVRDVAENPHKIGTAPAAVASTAGILVFHNSRQTRVRLFDPLETDAEGEAASDGAIVAPMHGKLVALLVEPGEVIARGRKLAVVEAMKMEHTLVAPFAGVVRDIAAHAGRQVAQGQKIMLIEREAART